MSAKSPTTSPELPLFDTKAPMSVLISMTVLTTAQLLPSSVTCPTRTPYSVMTQSPTSMPAFEPLLMVKECAQFDEVHDTIFADSSVISLCFFAKPSRVRSLSFSSTAS